MMDERLQPGEYTNPNGTKLFVGAVFKAGRLVRFLTPVEYAVEFPPKEPEGTYTDQITAPSRKRPARRPA